MPGYRSVWHRDPTGAWTFYATTPAEYSCARYFSSATTTDAVVCPIEVTRTGDCTLVVEIPDVLHWTIALHDTAATRLLTAIGWCADSLLGAGEVRLTGTMPNGQSFRIAPKRIWAVRASRAVLGGRDLGVIASLPEQARLVTFAHRNVAWPSSGRAVSTHSIRRGTELRPARPIRHGPRERQSRRWIRR